MALLRLSAVVVVAVAVGATAATEASAADPCAKQVAAVRKARSTRGRREARRALAECRLLYAASISPAHPHTYETITVTIHPSSPLRRGYLYEVRIMNLEGNAPEAAKRTSELTVQISPDEASTEPGHKVTEWVPGLALLLVIEGTPTQLKEGFGHHPKWREVANKYFGFLPRR